MAGISVDIRPAELRKALDAISFFRFGLRKEVEQITDTIGLLIESTAKENCPVDTGRLRASIHYDKAGGWVGTNVVYAPFQELGTVRHRAQPFLFPAAERWRQSYITAIKAAILSRG